jgi:tripartite-type tricarboxylate transporter receptor subunit TctC
MTEIPYKALSQSYVDLEGKQIDLMFIVSTATYNPKVFNLLANTSSKYIDNIPTLQKCLSVDQTISSQYLIVTNSTASDEFVKKMNKLALWFMKDSKNTQFFKIQNIDITAQNVELTNKQIRNEYNKWHFLLQGSKF